MRTSCRCTAEKRLLHSLLLSSLATLTCYRQLTSTSPLIKLSQHTVTLLQIRNWICVFLCCRGKELFPTKFIEFLTSKPGEDEDKKKKALIAELQSVNDHLEKSGKPYFGGDDVCATDLSMAPKIKHIKIGADEVKVGFDCNRRTQHDQLTKS